MHDNAISALNALVTTMVKLSICYQDAHWNVTGPHFDSLHALFGRHYADVSAQMDEVAERVRALGLHVTLETPLYVVPVGQDAIPGRELPRWARMLSDLLDDETTLSDEAARVRSLFSAMEDDASVDILNDVVLAADKRAWMLRASLET